MKKGTAFLLLTLAVLAMRLSAHGLLFQVERSAASVIVRCSYDGGGAIAYAPVKIFFDAEQIEFQNGRTDKLGCFAFVPDRPGRWLFQVDDEMGHRAEEIITVAEKSPPGQQKTAAGEAVIWRLLRLVGGAFLILLLTYGIYILLKRLRRGSGDRPASL